MSLLQVPLSYGELLDKLTILEIKSERMRDAAKLVNVRDERMLLEQTWREPSLRLIARLIAARSSLRKYTARASAMNSASKACAFSLRRIWSSMSHNAALTCLSAARSAAMSGLNGARRSGA